jgi:16S rRNA (cytosine967-C5)-methyltransferase
VPVDPAELMGLGHLISPAGMLRTLPCQSFGEGAIMQGMDGFLAARFRRA